MKQFYPINTLKTIFSTLFTIVLSISAANAQCPDGAITSPTNWGSYGAGQVVCISSISNINLTINSGATLVISNGGKATGQFSLNNGGTLVVQDGGEFAGTLYAYSGSSIFVNKGGKYKSSTYLTTTISNFGTFEMAGGGFNTGTSITNDGDFISSVSFSGMTFTNNACGTMTLKNGFSLTNTVLTNNGFIDAKSSFSIGEGSELYSRGKVYVGTSFTNSGKLTNHHILIAKGAGTLNANDSSVNLDKMVFTGGLTINGKVRNEGLLWTKGNITMNTSYNQNNPNAMLRIDGSFAKNPAITIGGRVYIGGNISYNYGLTNGISLANPLIVNKSLVQNIGANVQIEPSMVAADTTSFTAGWGSAASCQPPAQGTLPVVFGKMEAFAKNNLVVIDWSTQAEVNNARFVVEFSTNGTSFTTVGQVNGKINSQVVNNYSFTHNTPANGMNFYRLQIVSVDGEVEYSPVMKVNLKGGLTVNDVRTYPNPFVDRVNADITIENREQVQLRILDLNGKVLFSSQKTLTAGKHTMEAGNLQNLTKGIYILEIQAGTEKMVKKISK